MIVTPCVGVWIETAGGAGSYVASYVTPCVGVWIETPPVKLYRSKDLSHPAWVCGLKLGMVNQNHQNKVTPCVGVWIETHLLAMMIVLRCHTLRGCVD